MIDAARTQDTISVGWAARDDFPVLLDRLGCSLALSVRPDSIMFLGSEAGNQTVTATSVPKAMGLAVAGVPHRAGGVQAAMALLAEEGP